MIKYICNKCGREIRSNILKIATVDANDNKKTYHLCFTCALQFVTFMRISPDDFPVKEEKSKDSYESVLDVDPNKDQVADNVETTVSEVDQLGKNVDNNSTDEPKKKQRVVHITPEVEAYIQRYCEIKSAAVISKELGVNYQSVYQCCNKVLTQRRKKFGEIDAIATDNISKDTAGTCIALRRSGWTLEDIANEINKEVSDVSTVLFINHIE